MDNVKEWTGLSLNKIWMEPEDREHSLWESIFKKIYKQ